jgi:hypothetical protein
MMIGGARFPKIILLMKSLSPPYSGFELAQWFGVVFDCQKPHLASKRLS